MNVLIVPSWYPEGNDELLGIYHKEFASAISDYVNTNMLYIYRIGLSYVFKYPFMKEHIKYINLRCLILVKYFLNYK